MARPVNADAQATQGKILATAYELFASRGIDGASIRDIAKGAGVSLAMVHHYFGSKQGLYEACITTMLRELSELRDNVMSMLADETVTPARLTAHAIRQGYRFARKHRTAVRLFQRSLVDTGELDTRVRDENVAPFLLGASEILGQLLNKPAKNLRLPMQSVIFLIVRYAITSEHEVAVLAGERSTFDLLEGSSLNATNGATNGGTNGGATAGSGNGHSLIENGPDDAEATLDSSEGSVVDRAVEDHLVTAGIRILGLVTS